MISVNISWFTDLETLMGLTKPQPFSFCKKLGGIELTVMSGLDEDDDLAEWTEGGGMSVCISTDDARTLVNAFSSESESQKRRLSSYLENPAHLRVRGE